MPPRGPWLSHKKGLDQRDRALSGGRLCADTSVGLSIFEEGVRPTPQESTSCLLFHNEVHFDMFVDMSCSCLSKTVALTGIKAEGRADIDGFGKFVCFCFLLYRSTYGIIVFAKRPIPITSPVKTLGNWCFKCYLPPKLSSPNCSALKLDVRTYLICMQRKSRSWSTSNGTSALSTCHGMTSIQNHRASSEHQDAHHLLQSTNIEYETKVIIWRTKVIQAYVLFSRWFDFCTQKIVKMNI